VRPLERSNFRLRLLPLLRGSQIMSPPGRHLESRRLPILTIRPPGLLGLCSGSLFQNPFPHSNRFARPPVAGPAGLSLRGQFRRRRSCSLSVTGSNYHGRTSALQSRPAGVGGCGDRGNVLEDRRHLTPPRRLLDAHCHARCAVRRCHATQGLQAQWDRLRCPFHDRRRSAA
jgi:hypothetical protein